MTVVLGVASVVSALLVLLGAAVPLGWMIILSAFYATPALGLGRLVLREASDLRSVLVGLPLAFGYQFPLLAVAALWHWQPAAWALLSIVLGALPLLASVRRRSVDHLGASLGRLTLVALAVLVVVGALAVAASGRDSDDWAYGATVADYAANLPIGGSDPVLGSDLPMISREQFDLWTASLGVAARATAASVPQLLQDQLPPVIAVVTLAATFMLGVAIGGSPAWGIVAVVTQLAWFAVTTSWPQPGDAFLTRGDQDKVMAWLVLQPLVLLLFLELPVMGTPRKLVIGALSGLGLAAVHPVTHLLVLAALVVWVVMAIAAHDARVRSLWPAVGAFGFGLITTLLVLLGFQHLGPPPGSDLSAFLQAETLRVTAAHYVFSPRLPQLIIDPALVADGLTLVACFCAVIAVAVRRTPATLLVGALVVTTLALAFDPLVTPLIARASGDYLGLGLLLRIPWLLPVPFGMVALAVAWEGHLDARIPLLPLAVVALVVGIQVPQLDTAYHEWRGRVSQGWRDVAGVDGLYQAINARSSVDDVVLAPKSLEFRIPSHDPLVKLLAFRGYVGTVPHFPEGRVGEAVARAGAVDAFYGQHPDGFTAEDVATLGDYDVRFLILPAGDPRVPEASSRSWLQELSSTPDYVLFEVVGSPALPGG